MSTGDLELDQIADSFESSWRRGQRPDLDGFLARVHPSRKTELARLLVPLDIDYRRQRGDVIIADDYLPSGQEVSAIAARVLAGHSGLERTWDSGSRHRPVPVQAAGKAGPHSGREIGPYVLREQIGEGGMGSVWRAEQMHPVHREVAIKLIRADRVQSGSILARFEAERQAIALMDHPGIARLLEAGATGEGEPYFVMELVRGMPLTRYCDGHRLSVPERLELFAGICSAVQHAHQKGIIHRDLKPSNILVETREGRPQPRIIDFGLAKAVSGLALMQEAHETGFGMVLGTPLYMAPELASGRAGDADTRADVFSLGVILYELLTGTTPIRHDTLRRAGLEEMLRLIREADTPAPSSRISSSDSVSEVASRRRCEPSRLGRLVRGDLDWIVLRALARERDRRYPSPGHLAEDIQRFLRHEPVTAGPPSRVYRVRKFLRRHRIPIAAAGLVLAALMTGIVGTTLGMLEARRQQEIARRELADKELARQGEMHQRQLAERNLAFARRGNQMLGSVFAGLRPDASYETVALFREAMRDRLRQVAGQLEEGSVGEPLDVAELQYIAGQSLYHLGDHREAEAVLARALAIRQKLLGDVHPLTLESRQSIGRTRSESGQPDSAVDILRENLAARERLHGPDSPEATSSRVDLACCLQRLGQFEEALALQEEVVRVRATREPADGPGLLAARSLLAAILRDAGQLDQASAIYGELLPAYRSAHGDRHPDTLMVINNLAVVLDDLGEYQRALPLYREASESRREILGAGHPNSLISENNLATCYLKLKRFDEAMPILERVLAGRRTVLGPAHELTIVSLNNLASAFRETGQHARAMPLFREALAGLRETSGPEHPATLGVQNNLAVCLRDAGELEEARSLASQTLATARDALGPDHPLTLSCAHTHLTSAIRAEDYAVAIPLAEDLLERRSRALGPEHPSTVGTKGVLGGALCRSGDGERGAAVLTEFVDQQRRAMTPGHPAFPGLLEKVADDLVLGRQPALATSLLREALELRIQHQPDSWQRFDTEVRLGTVLLEQGLPDEAAQFLIRGIDGLRERAEQLPPAVSHRLPAAIDRLVELLETLGRSPEADRFRAIRDTPGSDR